MSVRKKIISGITIVFLIGLILGIVGLVCSSKLTTMADEQYELSRRSSSVSTVLNAHYTWKQTLTESVLFMKPFTGSLDSATCALGQWKNSDMSAGITDATLISLLNKLDEPHDFIHMEATKIVALIAEGDRSGAERVLNEEILSKANETISILTEIESRYAELLAEQGKDIIQVGSVMRVILIVSILVALVVSVLLAWKITSSIMKPLGSMAQAAETIAVGDLNVEIKYAVNDEIGMLASAFQKIVDATRLQISAAEALARGDLTASVQTRSNKDAMNIALSAMIDNLNNMFSGISLSAEQVAAGSRQISGGAQALAQGSTQQAAAVQQLSASIAEIAEQTDGNATMARRAAELADIIKLSAEKGSTQMDEMMNAVRDINQASHSISKVIKVIDDIAFQTNILALNAAVEAARAGQHGKGFAVVAEEVRNLAAKSAEAAKNTEVLIANSMEKAAFGSKIAEDTATSLTEIVAGINESTQLIGDIAKSSDEQSVGISQINSGIDQVAQVVQQNSATAEQSAAASEEMSGQSALLEDMVSKFKIRGGGSEAIGGRNATNKRLTTSRSLSSTEMPYRNTDDSSFGKY